VEGGGAHIQGPHAAEWRCNAGQDGLHPWILGATSPRPWLPEALRSLLSPCFLNDSGKLIIEVLRVLAVEEPPPSSWAHGTHTEGTCWNLRAMAAAFPVAVGARPPPNPPPPLPSDSLWDSFERVREEGGGARIPAHPHPSPPVERGGGGTSPHSSDAAGHGRTDGNNIIVGLYKFQKK